LLAVAVVPKVQQVPVFVDGEELAFISKWRTTINQRRAIAAVENVLHAHAPPPANTLAALAAALIGGWYSERNARQPV
jgi:hypothetical protein